MEVFEPWLQLATPEDFQQQELRFKSSASVLGKHALEILSAAEQEQHHKKHDSHHSHTAEAATASATTHPAHKHQHHAGHTHADPDHSHEEEHDHVHEGRTLVEANAVEKEGDDREER